MRPDPWTEHPTIQRLTGPIRTRLGISPHHASLQVGALRTHLLTAALAHAAAIARNTRAEVLLRWDDTDPARAKPDNELSLVHELTDVAGIPLHAGGHPAALLRQSGRQPAYDRALAHLSRLHLTRTAREGGTVLDLEAVDDLLAGHGIDPVEKAHQSVVNIRRVPAPQHSTLRLTRSDGTPLWHLATVVDDIDAGINLIVRGTDKIDATSIQERLRAVLAAHHQVAYLFLPRLTGAPGTPKLRVRDALANGIRPEALRWYLAETYLRNDEPATTFDHILERLRPVLPRARDSRIDVHRLEALSHKVESRRRAAARRGPEH
ncbi:hypothetical protein [Myceligenerans crystallogenes]|uniref:Glutamyl-tRNA synthetase n=1 Tax=Myceligenerans crystallogenes TaxID=316335 RepID=A0ABN2NAV0_9MICO